MDWQLAAAVGPASLLVGVKVGRSSTFPSMPQQAASITAAASYQSTAVGPGEPQVPVPPTAAPPDTKRFDGLEV